MLEENLGELRWMEKLGFMKELWLEGDNNIPDLSPYDKYSQFEAVLYSKPI